MRKPDILTCVIGTAGHIDHGKTSLVRALTGMETDRLPEEKRRGLSIDLGFASIDLGDNDSPMRAAIVDVPGHERFIRNMLAGATGMDIVLFCVASDDGIMPQTREHLDIVRLLGVRQGVFAITKSDIASPERVFEVKRALTALLGNTAFANSPIITVSSTTGAGICALKELLKTAALQARRTTEARAGFFRLPIDRSFHIKGFGTVVTGTAASGSVKNGAELLCFPNGNRVKVRGMESLHTTVDEAEAGQRIALNISGVSINDTGRGVVLVSPELTPFVEAASTALRHGSGQAASKNTHVYTDCSFEFIKPVDLKKGRKTFKIYHQTAESIATIRLTNEGRACGRLMLKIPLLMLRGDRFIIRDTAENDTVGAGVVNVTWLSKKQMPRKPVEGGADIPGLLERGLVGVKGVRLSEAALMLNLRADVLEEIIGKTGRFVILGEYVINAQYAAEATKRLHEAVVAHHSANPMDAGIKIDAAIKTLRLADSGLANTIVDFVVSSPCGALKKNGALLSLSGHCPASIGVDVEIEAAIKGLFSNGFIQPSAENLKKLTYKKTEIDRVFAYLLRNGALIKLREGSYLGAEALTNARANLAEHFKTNTEIKASEFRDILNCGRKLAIEILEYFDKERVTLRRGDVRTLR